MRSSPCTRGRQRLFDIARLDDILHLLCLVSPNAGEAVGLELDTDLQGIALPLDHALPHRLDLIHDTEQFLHMVPDLMGDDIGLAQSAGALNRSLSSW